MLYRTLHRFPSVFHCGQVALIALDLWSFPSRERTRKNRQALQAFYLSRLLSPPDESGGYAQDSPTGYPPVSNEQFSKADTQRTPKNRKSYPGWVREPANRKDFGHMRQQTFRPNDFQTFRPLVFHCGLIALIAIDPPKGGHSL